MSSTESVALEASNLLRRFGTDHFPIDVAFIAQKLEVHLHFEQLEDEISGMLIVKDGSKHIVINKGHHANRQRFTIAHEIGHLILHHEDGDKLFVDTKLMVYQRAGVPSANTYSSKNSTTTPDQEREANVFAASLLMPEDALRELIEDQEVDISDEFDISRLASSLGVSEQAMSIRLKNLKLVDYV